MQKLSDKKQSAKSLIKAVDVTVKRNRKTILQSISLEIVRGDFITVIGPNGAGKSLLMKCLMGFYAPDQGIVESVANLKIGHVPQRFAVDLTVPITVRKFLYLRKSVNHEAIEKIANDTDIFSLLDKNMYFLSGGELQRVLLARALVGEPELLMLDEPTQNLDIKSRLSFYRLLEKIYESRKITIMMISHDLQMLQILERCTRQVICLFNRIRCYGSFSFVINSAEFRDIFGKDMVDILGLHQKKHLTQFVDATQFADAKD